MQWITNSVHSTNEHPFPTRKMLAKKKRMRKRWTKVFQAHHHTSKACRNTQWRKYVSFSVSSSTIFCYISGLDGRERPTDQRTNQARVSKPAKRREIALLLRRRRFTQHNLNVRCEHCRLNYNLPVVGICVLELKLCARCSAIRCMLCTNTPVFGNSTITN